MAGISTDSLTSKVELSVSASNLQDRDVMSVSDPVCVLFIKEMGDQNFREFGRTEMIKNSLNPQWVHKFNLDYRFEERQMLSFHIYDWDNKSHLVDQQDSLGFIECSLGEVMSQQCTEFKRQLNTQGTICIYGEEQSASKEIITLKCSGKGLDKKDFFGKSDPFLVISRSAEGTSYIPVHKTEVIKKTLDPFWNIFSLRVGTLCFGDYDRMIRIECYDWDSDGSHDLIGECFVTLRTLLKTGEHELINAKKKEKKKSYKDSGRLQILQSFISIEHSFLDYIQGGLQLHFTVAVDFTASNGNPSTPQSLHYNQGVENQYQRAIKGVGEIIQDYDSDKLFPALGFGGKLPSGQVSHEFYLNGRVDSPYCQGVDGILQAYLHSLQTVQLYGPTNFAPIINHVMKFAEAHQDGNNYFVLLIITDGLISDMMLTKQALIRASVLPMSVIIVGVGNEDFSAMELLDGDNKRLQCDGVMASRDIVQFVGGPNMAQTKERLAKDVLAEIPLQVVTWMKSRKFDPKPVQRPT